MEIEISGAEPYEIEIIAPPHVGIDVEAFPMEVSVEIVRDGKDGLNGGDKTFDELRSENNSVSGDILFQGIGTVGKIRHAVSGDEAVPYEQAEEMIRDQQTLERARFNNPRIDGDIDAHGSTIIDIRNASAQQEPVTLAQLQAESLAIREYADTVSSLGVQWRGEWDFSSGLFPNGIAGGIKAGYQWVASNANTVTISGIEIEKGELVTAKVNTPGQDVLKWHVGQGNVEQATEGKRGLAKICLGSDLSNVNTTNNQDIVPPVKIWGVVIPTFISSIWTWTARQNFNQIRLPQLTSNQYLKLNATKDIESVPSIPQSDVTGLLATLINLQNQISASAKFFLRDFDLSANLIGFMVETIAKSHVLPAGTFQLGSWAELYTRLARNNQGFAATTRVYICDTPDKTGANNFLIGYANAFNANLNGQIRRQLHFTAAGLKVIDTTTYDDITAGNSTPVQTYPVGVASTWYLVVTVQNSSSATSTYQNYIDIVTLFGVR